MYIFIVNSYAITRAVRLTVVPPQLRTLPYCHWFSREVRFLMSTRCSTVEHLVKQMLNQDLLKRTLHKVVVRTVFGQRHGAHR